MENKDLTEFPSSTYTEKEVLSKRFEYISDRVKLFSSLCKEPGGKHIRFDYSSNDECDDSDENIDGDNTSRQSRGGLSYDNSSQTCPYPSAAEEKLRLGLKSNTDEKPKPLMDKLMDIWDRSSARKQKQKRKRQEKHDNTMNKFLRKGGVNDFTKKLEGITLSGCDMEKFVTTWKDTCREHSIAEVCQF